MNTSKTSARARLPRTVLLLCLSQIVGSLGLAAGATAGPLLAELITGSAAYGPTAMGALVTGSALAGPAAGAIMRRLGRVWGPAACNLCATVGAAIVVFSVDWGLASLLAGTVLLGAGTTGVMLGRYLATDLVDEHRAPQAMGLAVAAVTVGAVLGPVLLGPTGAVAEAAGLPPQTGLHLLAVAVFPLASLILLKVRGGGAPEAPATDTPATERGPGRLLPLLVLGTGNLSMVAIMGSVPNHLQHSGWDLQAVGMFAALHIGAMFAFAPVSAALCRRFGPRPVALAAALCMTGSLAFGVLGGGIGSDLALLALVGVSWNLHLVSGSMWLVEVTPEPLRHRAEGLGELAMGAAAAAGSLGLAGPLLSLGGLPLLCLVMAAVNVATAVALSVRARSRRTPAAMPPVPPVSVDSSKS